MPPFFHDPHLTPLTGTVLIVFVVLAGHRFRKAWKDRGCDPRWHRRAWVYGVFAFFGLLVLAFVPMQA